ncbi:prolipoprotein diacylglyceryl transferase [Peloplasma aerotolerans]|jgi:phosphatidylglycerol---prolipoprotein diacylglyceryl transferase|uniref:Phosphatidylglycerol--prolipoprotein diacylglyceryl transferase n=1 Tax=Peloplasma aerotolerans TaxID=3044389 RepID=A0AAW6U856_9MOLU|nr:prolipoprotein diacylglyceryl transferase [Mariniplasma sp. M4Ah]MDI6452134.1 prolipoprotein diacylglyceryl transferase [Mariniplasma sp. M4Ah]MDR4967993.1 prolipoprotein diacylglyceryl transferase [Acholeplasmataceae bacterium]
MIDYFKKNKKAFYIYGGAFAVFMLMIILAVATQTGTPYNNIAVDLGFAQIAWYAVFILTGISLGAFLTYWEFKRVGWDTEILFDALLYAVPLSIIGSRLYYVIFDPTPNYNSFIDVINITSGGLSIHGAVITAFIFVVIFTKKKKINFWILADMLAIGFLVGQIVGRWGNFMNAEAYGPIIESQFILNILPGFIKEQMFIAGNYHHPTFLYEGIWNFMGLVFLLVARRKRWFRIGDTIGLYLIWYGLGRGAIIEPLRTGGHPGDALRMFGLPANIVLSLTLFMLGGVAIIVAKKYYYIDQPYYVDVLIEEEVKIENNPA